MSKKTIYPIIVAGAISLLGLGTVSACNGWFNGWGTANGSSTDMAQRQQQMFQYEAQILGLSADDVKNAWAEGKSLKQLMQEKNISRDQVNARIKEQQLQEMKTYLKALVDKGVITQAQADKRLQVFQERFQNSKGFRKGFLKGWYGRF